MLTLAAHISITAGFFCVSTLFYNDSRDSNKRERENFFEDIETPVVADHAQDEYDRQQRQKLAGMVTYMAAGILLMALIPNPLWGRITFVGCALVILAVGLLLRQSTKAETPTA